MRVLFVWPNKDAFGFKPIGLSLLSGIAKNLNWDTKLFDTTEIDFGYVDNSQKGESAKVFKHVDMDKYGHQKRKIDLGLSFTRVIEEYNPDCLALSVLCDEFLIASKISALAKEINPELPIIWGGKYPTLNPEKTLNMHYADFVCVYEGLEAFGDFLKALSGMRDIDNIPNIWMKKNGLIIKNEIRPLKNGLDDLPYLDWSLFDKRQFYKAYDGKAYVSGDHMLNWGCPYRCTYCINHIYHDAYNNKYNMRRYSTQRIVDELKCLKDQYGIEFIKFHDEDFLMRPLENLRELSEAYRKEVNVPFVTATNAISATEKKVELLKSMNCVSVTIGIETGDAETRKNLLGRLDTEEDIVRAFSLFKAAGIRTSSFNMLGLPYETRERFKKTVELNRKANVQYPNIGFFYPFEGTELREISIKGGFFDPEGEDNVYCRDKPALRFDNLSECELKGMLNAFVLHVKLPGCFGSFIERSETEDDLGIKLRRKILEIYNKTVWENDGWYDDDGLKDDYIDELKGIAGEI